MLSFSVVRFRSVAAVFFDFNHACPSLGCRLMMASLARLGIPLGIMSIIGRLCDDSESLLPWALFASPAA